MRITVRHSCEVHKHYISKGLRAGNHTRNDDAMDPFLMLTIVLVIYIIIYIIGNALGFEKLSERGFELGFPLLVMIKTERLNNFLTRMGKKFPRAFFNAGIIVAFGGMAFGLYMFTLNLLNFFFAPASAGGVVPIIPGITVTGLPLIYMMIGVAVTFLTHEFAHGLASSKDNITIKSSGLLFFYVLFGAFVEPDEDEFKQKASIGDRMRMLSAGSFANLIWGFIFLALIANFSTLMSIGFNQPSGAYIYEITPGSAAANGGMQVGDTIIQLNETAIDNWANVSAFMVDTVPNSNLTIHLMNGTVFDVTLGENPTNSTKGYIGILGVDYWEPKPGWEFLGPLYAFNAQMTLQWTFLILFSVGIFNLLPIPALDGDGILSNALSLKIKDEKKVKTIMWPIRIFSLGVIILSIVMTSEI